MKVLIPVIRGNSGSDVYSRYLGDALCKINVPVDVEYLPHYIGLLPYIGKGLLLWMGRLKTYDLVHTNADYGRCFKISGKRFVVTVHHNFFDDRYQYYTSTTQKLYHHSLLKRRVREALTSTEKIIAVIYNGIDAGTFKPRGGLDSG